VLDNEFKETSAIEKKHSQGVTAMAASPGGQFIASGDNYRYIYVFNAETKEEVACFTHHTAKVTGLVFNPSSTLLATVSVDQNVGVANLTDKSKPRVIESKRP